MTATATDPPQVAKVLRFGFHDQKTFVMIDFNGPLDATSAEAIANYTIAGPVGKHGHSSQRIKVGSALYDAATHTVTLVPTARLNIHKTYTLTINGRTPSGVANPSGLMLDEVGNGVPGRNYLTSLTWRNLSGPAHALPTLHLVDAAREAKAVARTSIQHAHTTGHHAAVNYLLESGLLRVPKHDARS